MTKRHDSLIPLTHDHHHALAQARRLETAAGGQLTDRTEQARAFLEFFETDTIGHFREEEEIIFPLVIDVPEAKPLLNRLLLEHVRLHALVSRLRAEVAVEDASAEAMTLIARLLQGHIREEEKALFPLVESVAADPLAAVALAPRDRSAAALAER